MEGGPQQGEQRRLVALDVYTQAWNKLQKPHCSSRLNCSFVSPSSGDYLSMATPAGLQFLSLPLSMQSTFILSMSANSSLIKASGNLTINTTEMKRLSAHWLVYVIKTKHYISRCLWGICNSELFQVLTVRIK